MLVLSSCILPPCFSFKMLVPKLLIKVLEISEAVFIISQKEIARWVYEQNQFLKFTSVSGYS